MRHICTALLLLTLMAGTAWGKSYKDYVQDISNLNQEDKDYFSKVNDLCDKALKDKAYADKKQQAFFYSRKCSSYIAHSSPSPGLKFCKKSMELNPDDSATYFYSGIIHEKSGEMEKAIEYVETAKEKMTNAARQDGFEKVLVAYAEKLKNKKNSLYALALPYAYAENAILADEKFKGKTFRVFGFASEIGQSKQGSYYIYFTDPKNAPGDVLALFQDKEREKLLKLRKDDRVYFIGKVRGWDKFVILDDCLIIP